jgi:hypothetical protein
MDDSLASGAAASVFDNILESANANTRGSNWHPVVTDNCALLHTSLVEWSWPVYFVSTFLSTALHAWLFIRARDARHSQDLGSRQRVHVDEFSDDELDVAFDPAGGMRPRLQSSSRFGCGLYCRRLWNVRYSLRSVHESAAQALSVAMLLCTFLQLIFDLADIEAIFLFDQPGLTWWSRYQCYSLVVANSPNTRRAMLAGWMWLATHSVSQAAIARGDQAVEQFSATDLLPSSGSDGTHMHNMSPSNANGVITVATRTTGARLLYLTIACANIMMLAPLLYSHVAPGLLVFVTIFGPLVVFMVIPAYLIAEIVYRIVLLRMCRVDIPWQLQKFRNKWSNRKDKREGRSPSSNTETHASIASGSSSGSSHASTLQQRHTAGGGGRPLRSPYDDISVRSSEDPGRSKQSGGPCLLFRAMNRCIPVATWNERLPIFALVLVGLIGVLCINNAIIASSYYYHDGGYTLALQHLHNRAPKPTPFLEFTLRWVMLIF